MTPRRIGGSKHLMTSFEPIRHTQVPGYWRRPAAGDRLCLSLSVRPSDLRGAFKGRRVSVRPPRHRISVSGLGPAGRWRPMNGVVRTADYFRPCVAAGWCTRRKRGCAAVPLHHRANQSRDRRMPTATNALGVIDNSSFMHDRTGEDGATATPCDSSDRL